MLQLVLAAAEPSAFQSVGQLTAKRNGGGAATEQQGVTTQATNGTERFRPEALTTQQLGWGKGMLAEWNGHGRKDRIRNQMGNADQLGEASCR
jgi:hypothetical protein